MKKIHFLGLLFYYIFLLSFFNKKYLTPLENGVNEAEKQTGGLPTFAPALQACNFLSLYYQPGGRGLSLALGDFTSMFGMEIGGTLPV